MVIARRTASGSTRPVASSDVATDPSGAAAITGERQFWCWSAQTKAPLGELTTASYTAAGVGVFEFEDTGFRTSGPDSRIEPGRRVADAAPSSGSSVTL